jgi:hypothetical protein
MDMQNDINFLVSNLFPQTLGMTDTSSILVLSLVAPGALMFAILFFGRELLRPRWRGYWDAV